MIEEVVKREQEIIQYLIDKKALRIESCIEEFPSIFGVKVKLQEVCINKDDFERWRLKNKPTKVMAYGMEVKAIMPNGEIRVLDENGKEITLPPMERNYMTPLNPNYAAEYLGIFPVDDRCTKSKTTSTKSDNYSWLDKILRKKENGDKEMKMTAEKETALEKFLRLNNLKGIYINEKNKTVTLIDKKDKPIVVKTSKEDTFDPIYGVLLVLAYKRSETKGEFKRVLDELLESKRYHIVDNTKKDDAKKDN